MARQQSIMPASVAAAVQSFLHEHFTLRHALAQGVVNLSALARIIMREKKLASFEAVVKSLQRLAVRSRRRTGSSKDPAHQVLKASTISAQRDLSVLVIALDGTDTAVDLVKYVRRLGSNCSVLFQSTTFGIVLVRTDVLPVAKSRLGAAVLRVTSGVAKLTLTFPAEVETTVGVVAHAYSLLAARGVNVLEEVSCWTELTVIIQESDLGTAVSALTI